VQLLQWQLPFWLEARTCDTAEVTRCVPSGRVVLALGAPPVFNSPWRAGFGGAVGAGVDETRWRGVAAEGSNLGQGELDAVGTVQ
jgi:hypothetical protein